MEERVEAAFSRLKVKRPFALGPELVTYTPTEADVSEVVFRLEEILERSALLALDDEEFGQRVRQVWELVRWIHTDQSPTARTVV